MPSISLYREGIDKQSGLFIGGISRTYRSMRASWESVHVEVDGGRQARLTTGKICSIDVDPGEHQLVASGHGFVSATMSVSVADQETAIVGINPMYLEGRSQETPLGSLHLYRAGGPEDLGTFRFYKNLPMSSGNGDSVTPAVAVSIAYSVAFLVIGVVSVAAIPWAAFSRSVAVALILLLPLLFVASIFIPAGLDGVVAGVRFLRLPREWRRPGSVAG